MSAVIDFGGCAVGDPACDLTVAWTTFAGEASEAFRTGTGLDDGTWARARGWALWKALITLLLGPRSAETARIRFGWRWGGARGDRKRPGRSFVVGSRYGTDDARVPVSGSRTTWPARAKAVAWVPCLPGFPACLGSLPVWVPCLSGFPACLGSLPVWVPCLQPTSSTASGVGRPARWTASWRCTRC